jgi:hypothetical protein
MNDSLVSKDELLINKLIDFYSNSENINILLPIILQKTRISLRLLDWFVTNYSKKYNINYPIINEHNEEVVFFPYKNYKLQLKAYSKKFCDPFCRRDRVIFDYGNNKIIDTTKINLELSSVDDSNKYIITTVGQLNFFKFAIQTNIIKYANDNIILIENDMNKTLKVRNTEKKFMEVKNIKRKELSEVGNKSVYITRISATIKFL